MSHINKIKLQEFLDKIKHLELHVIGDVMLDKYIHCNSTTKTENNYEVYKYEREEYHPGGAGNVACIASDITLNNKKSRISISGITGMDRESDILHKLMVEEYNINTNIITTPRIDTIVKTRILVDNKLISRIDTENIDELEFTFNNRYNIKENKVKNICLISDYNKGVFNKSTKWDIQSYPVAYYGNIKPANIELSSGMNMVQLNELEWKETGYDKYLTDRYNIQNVIITLGPKGQIFYEKYGNNSEEREIVKSVDVKVKDTCGAGDISFVVNSLALHVGYNIYEACELSNYISSISISKGRNFRLTPENIINNYEERDDNL